MNPITLAIGLWIASVPGPADVTKDDRPVWTPQASGTAARLRGVHAVSDRVVWASGTGGTFLRTVDGGTTWKASTVPGDLALDFRDVRAVDDRTAYLLSCGPGETSRVYTTTDAGATWVLRFTNPEPAGFLDAVAFWDDDRGLALGDPVGGRFAVFRTIGGGTNWRKIDPQSMPAALEREGAFAASGTCLVVHGERHAWFATGGGGLGRVFRSVDGGRNWSAATTPVRAAGPSEGLFSVAFRDGSHGVVIGGDYKTPAAPGPYLARTADGGKTWALVADAPRGYRSAVAYAPGAETPTLVAVGPTGSDLSTDDGATWRSIGADGFHALSLVSSRTGWAVGDAGRVARLNLRDVKNRDGAGKSR